jgi:hypothetical protein
MYCILVSVSKTAKDIGKEMFVACVKVLSQHFPGGTGKIRFKPVASQIQISNYYVIIYGPFNGTINYKGYLEVIKINDYA